MINKSVKDLTHDDIAEVGARWLRSNGFPVALANLTSATHGEKPDALGMNAFGETFLLEAKTSRSDFRADLKKPWRSNGKAAIGDSRGYITPKGLLKPEEIPYGWWLLEVHGKTKPVVKVIKGKKKVKQHVTHGWSAMLPVNATEEELSTFKGSNIQQPYTWLIKIIRRAEEAGVDMSQFSTAN